MDKRLLSVLPWVVAALTPVVLVLLGVRLMLFPGFPQIEYAMPGFPTDPNGFSPQERLKWADYSVRYLTNGEGIGYLGELRFRDGTPAFNARELSHMEDVKALVRMALGIFYAAALALLLLGIWAWRGNWMADFRRGLSKGGWLTVILVVLAGGFALFQFEMAFVLFHRLFFAGVSWLFQSSDTLIRLFPERFWEDVAAYDMGLALICGAALGFALGFLPSKSKKA